MVSEVREKTHMDVLDSFQEFCRVFPADKMHFHSFGERLLVFEVRGICCRISETILPGYSALEFA